ncbi:MAG TPA: universal stress protein [Gammaproteobacteria bacterium]|nr:universal stress protein [Gammaproteobacteria bacterium]
MGGYTHLLLAVDFTDETGQVAERAVQLARAFDAGLSFIHVVEFLHMDLANELVLPQDVELEEQMVASARRKLQELAEGLGMPDAPCRVELGATKQEILRVAAEQKIDLIVVGSHGRHGIQRLLGSTANAVLHGAPCDVLAVRIAESDGS